MLVHYIVQPAILVSRCTSLLSSHLYLFSPTPLLPLQSSSNVLLILSLHLINLIVHVRISTQKRLAFQKIEKSVVANLETEKENDKQVRDTTDVPKECTISDTGTICIKCCVLIINRVQIIPIKVSRFDLSFTGEAASVHLPCRCGLCHQAQSQARKCS